MDRARERKCIRAYGDFHSENHVDNTATADFRHQSSASSEENCWNVSSAINFRSKQGKRPGVPTWEANLGEASLGKAKQIGGDRKPCVKKLI